MSAKKIQMSDVAKDQLQIVLFLSVSGGLGYVLSTYILKDPALTAIFAPAINYVLYIIKQEIDKKGVIQALKNQEKWNKERGSAMSLF